jgi:iron complex transport system substrate-binding protein
MINSLRQIMLALAFLGAAFNASAGEMPKRVVSLNVCTDQLAILLAKPGQLHSVSFLAADPKSSVLFEEAQRYKLNHGNAEEVFLMRPDLVLAGTFTTRTTVTMLRRLGFQVEEFAPESSIDEVKSNITRMGDLLGTQSKAIEINGEIDARLAKLQKLNARGPVAAFYYSNSYTAGSGTIIADIAKLAGLRNLAEESGLYSTAYLSLEQLVMSKPELIIANETTETSPALAQQNFKHPAYRALLAKTPRISIDGRLTACGGPFTMLAIEQLNAAALALQSTEIQ